MNSTIFIGFLFILFIACFIGILKWVGRRTAKKDIRNLMLSFEKMETSNKILIDTREMINKRVIGIDKAAKKILFIDHTRSDRQELLVDLSLIKEANIINRKNLFSKHTGTILIECCFIDPVVQPVELTFYDEYYDDADSIAQIEKKATCWHQTIHIFKTTDTKQSSLARQNSSQAFIKK